MRRTLGALLASLTLAANCGPSVRPAPEPTATAPSPAASPSAGVGTGPFRYAITEPGAIVPGDVVDPGGLTVVDTLFDSLTAYDRDGATVPAAAVAWTPDPSATAWTFTLRPGATFHDGSPVTARSFLDAWTRAARRGAAGYHLADVEGYARVTSDPTAAFTGLRAVNDATLVVRLVRPLADFPAVVAHPALGPLPPSALTGADLPAGFADRPVGNGPFQLAEPWARGRFLRAVRFEAWRNGSGPAELSEVLFKFDDPDTAYVAFQQGRRDFAAIPTGALAQAQRRYRVSPDGYSGPGVLTGVTGSVYYLGMDLAAPPFTNVDVRRALSLAVDRETLARANREGNAEPARAAASRSVPGARFRNCDNCRHDPDEARRLFAEAGVTELELWFNQGGGHERIAAALTDQLEAVGVTLRTRSPELAPGQSPLPAYLEALGNGSAPLFRFGWSVDYPTLDNALTPLFSGGAAGAEGAGNYGRFADPEVDGLLATARATLDEAARRDLYVEAEELALDRHQAIVPLLFFRLAAVVSDRVEGFVLSPLGTANLAEVRLLQAPSSPSGEPAG